MDSRLAGGNVEDMALTRAVEREFVAAAEIFAGPPSRWLPVIVGPEERSWRAETREGAAAVRVVVTAGAVVVRRDRVRWRRFTIQPDPTDRTAFLAAWLTPAVVGDLGLAPTDDDTAELRFEGTTETRSWMTNWLERFLVGDRLSRSAVDTLLGQIAEQLATASADEEAPQTSGSHTCLVAAPTSE